MEVSLSTKVRLTRTTFASHLKPRTVHCSARERRGEVLRLPTFYLSDAAAGDEHRHALSSDSGDSCFELWALRRHEEQAQVVDGVNTDTLVRTL